MKKQTTMSRLISFSGGRSSAYMLYQMLPLHPDDHVVFANTGREHPATLDFIRDISIHWDVTITWVEYDPEMKGKFKIVDYDSASRNGEPYAKLIAKRKYLPNIMTRFCTSDLKVKPMKRYMQYLGYKFWDCVLGIRYDEPFRWGRILQNSQKEPWFYVLPMVLDFPTSKPDVLEFWKTMPFDLQIHGDQGNCDLCFLKGRGKLVRLIKENPKLADWWKEQEQNTGSKFIKDISYQELVHVARTQLTIDFDSIDYPCHCNID